MSEFHIQENEESDYQEFPYVIINGWNNIIAKCDSIKDAKISLKLLQCSEGLLEGSLMDFIIKEDLISAHKEGVMIWTQDAEERIEQFIKSKQEKILKSGQSN